MQARPSNAGSPEAVEAAAWMELDASALRANLEVLQRLVGEHVRIIPSLKANAYGHGAVWVAQEFEAAGVGMLATGSFADAVAMRQAGVQASIIHFGTYLAAGVPQLLAHDLTPTVWDLATATAVSEAAQGPTAV